MNKKKLLGYILLLLGLLALAINFGFLKITLPETIKPIYLLIAGIVLIILGFFLAFSRKKHTSEEVPIYQGNKIIGYRKK